MDPLFIILDAFKLMTVTNILFRGSDFWAERGFRGGCVSLHTPPELFFHYHKKMVGSHGATS